MPIHAKLDIGGTMVPCSGVMRSTDGGQSWGDFTQIACDRDTGKIEFGPTAVYADAS